jgi:hypothetical protein
MRRPAHAHPCGPRARHPTAPPQPTLPAGVIALRRDQRLTFLAQRESFEQLLTRLRHLGGERIVIPPAPDDDLGRLLGPDARAFDGTGVLIRPGLPSACHANVAALWRRGEAQIVTGYALSADGLWRQHSWGLTTNDCVIESTLARVRYFGICLGADHADAFAEANTH